MLHARYDKKQRWWVFFNKPKSTLFGEFLLQIGPYLAVAIWSLKWAKGNFKWLILINGIINAVSNFYL